MRSIGKRNIKLVIKATQIEIEKANDGGMMSIEKSVIEHLPIELWETWEMADQEIRGIIFDTIFKRHNTLS